MNRATNVVTHTSGNIETLILRGSHRNAGCGSPLAASAGCTVTNYWYKDLAFNSGAVTAKSGSGSVTNDNAYAEAGVTTYVSDTFTAANGTALNGRTPSPTDPGATWATQSGTAGNQTIQSNKASFACNNSREDLVIDAGVSDGTIEATMTIPATGSIGILMFRVQDVNNYWQLTIDDTQTVLYRIVAGAVDYSSIVTQAHASGTPYTLRVTLSGNSVSGEVVGETPIATTSSVGAARTKHGIGGYYAGTGNVTADDFTVTS